MSTRKATLTPNTTTTTTTTTPTIVTDDNVEVENVMNQEKNVEIVSNTKDTDTEVFEDAIEEEEEEATSVAIEKESEAVVETVAEIETVEEIEENIDAVEDVEQLEVIEKEQHQEEDNKTAEESVDELAETTELVIEETEIEAETETILTDEEELNLDIVESTTNKTTIENKKDTDLDTAQKMRPILIRGRKSIKELKVKEEPNTAMETETAGSVQEANEKDKKPKVTTPIKEDCEKSEKELSELEEVIVKNKDKDEAIPEESTIVLLTNTATSRLTRKSAAQEFVPTVRVTRNRQHSRPETPPSNNVSITTTNTTAAAVGTISARTRRSLATRKSAEIYSATLKRKRGSEEQIMNEPVHVKHIKVEGADDMELGDETETTEVLVEASDLPKIKQEIVESDESLTPTACLSMRGRPRGRKSQTPTISGSTVSPSTRTTRHTKLAIQSCSPSAPTTVPNCANMDGKRRRTALVNSANKPRSLSLLKCKPEHA